LKIHIFCSEKRKHLFVDNYSSFWYSRTSPMSQPSSLQIVLRLSHDILSLFLNFWIVDSEKCFSLRKVYEEKPFSLRASKTSILYFNAILIPPCFNYSFLNKYIIKHTRNQVYKITKNKHENSCILPIDNTRKFVYNIYITKNKSIKKGNKKHVTERNDYKN